MAKEVPKVNVLRESLNKRQEQDLVKTMTKMIIEMRKLRIELSNLSSVMRRK